MEQAVEHPTTRRAQSQTTSRRPSQAFAVLGICVVVIVIGKINLAATQSLQSLNFNVHALALVENLGAAKRQMVEIVRAVRQNAKVFIVDEPTASLKPEETHHLFYLFHLLHVLPERGAGIIFIAHALREALDLADRIPAPRQAVRDGSAYLTEDPKLDSFFETVTVDQNIYLGYLAPPRVRRFLYSWQEMKHVTDRWVEALSISALERSLKIVEYFGGHQQKVVVAKSLVQEASVIVLDESTRESM